MQKRKREHLVNDKEYRKKFIDVGKVLKKFEEIFIVGIGVGFFVAVVYGLLSDIKKHISFLEIFMSLIILSVFYFNFFILLKDYFRSQYGGKTNSIENLENNVGYVEGDTAIKRTEWFAILNRLFFIFELSVALYIIKNLLMNNLQNFNKLHIITLYILYVLIFITLPGIIFYFMSNIKNITQNVYEQEILKKSIYSKEDIFKAISITIYKIFFQRQNIELAIFSLVLFSPFLFLNENYCQSGQKSTFLSEFTLTILFFLCATIIHISALAYFFIGTFEKE